VLVGRGKYQEQIQRALLLDQKVALLGDEKARLLRDNERLIRKVDEA
jgi:hypothetical protein